MKKAKKILSLMLILIMCFSVMPMTEIGIEASAGMTLAQLRQKFPNGKYWNHAGNPGASNSVNNQDGYTSTPCSQHGVVGTSAQTCNGFCPSGTQLSWQCMGYAEKLGYDATGYNPRNNANGWTTYTSSSALNNLKPGDIVRYKSDGHSIYVTGVSGDTVTYTDCNSDGHCKIRWDATISKSTLKSTFTHVRSAPSAVTGGSSTSPTITSANGESHSEITIKWGKVDSATKYKVERRKSGTDDYVVAVSSTTSTSFTDTGLEKGQRYFYKVTAYNGSTKLGTSEAVGVYTKFSPPTVTAVSNSKLQVSWSSISKAVDYTVMRRKASEDEYSEIKTVTGTSFTDSGLSSSTQYYYWIKANCEVDGVDMVAKSTTGGQYTLTNSPEITNINDISKSEITITWKSVSGASSYRIERRKSGTDTYTTIVNSTTNTSYTDSGLATGERYYYRVYAKNQGGESAASVAVGGYTKFNQPTVQTVSTSQLKLTWNAVSKAESYTIKRRAYNETSYKDIKTVTSTSYTDTGLNSGTKYYYWIQANCNIDGTSMVAKSTTGSNFTQITNPSVSVISSSSLKLSWNAIKDDGTYKYNIQRKAPGESSYKTIATVNTTSYTDTGLKSSSTYYYKIQVVSSSNTVCLTSSEVSGKTSACTHSSTEVRNAKSATCTATGYTGDTYCKTCGAKTKTGSTISKKAHSYTSTITTQPTCTKEGVKTYKCSCGASYTEAIAKKSHSIVTISAVAATCTKTGLTEGKKCSTCGTITVAQQTVAKIACADNNGDGKCDNCGANLGTNTPTTPDEPENKPCSCNCHKGGISGFFFKIINFFEKLFGKNKVCACGMKH